MSTKIRLARGGKKKRPYYRIVVADSRAPRDGKFIERLGSYDPLLEENKVSMDVERARHWLDLGAQPSQRVSKLMALQGIEHKMLDLPDPAVIAAKTAEIKAKKEAEAAAKKAEEEKAAAEAAASAAAAAASEKAAAEEAAAEAAPAEEEKAAEETPAEG